MKLRDANHALLGEMDRDELQNYAFDLEREVYRLRRKSRCHRKSMREMQAKLEKNNLILSERQRPLNPAYPDWAWRRPYWTPWALPIVTTGTTTCGTTE